jgi:hypothetical protein
MSSEPSRARAVFSTRDFALLRTAILHYLDEGPAGPERERLGQLYHRLGRLS